MAKTNVQRSESQPAPQTYQGSRPGWMTPGNGGRSTRPKTARRRWRGKALKRVWSSEASGTRVEASRGVEHYTRLPEHTSLRLTTNKPNRLGPDVTQQHTRAEARPQAAPAQPSKARA